MSNERNMKFSKTFNVDTDSNEYITRTENTTYELYRERTYKNNGTSKCDGNWIVQINGRIEDTFRTLKEAKNYIGLWA